MLIIIFKYLYSTVHPIDTSENSKGSLTLTCLFAFVFMGEGHVVVVGYRRRLPVKLSDRLLDLIARCCLWACRLNIFIVAAKSVASRIRFTRCRLRRRSRVSQTTG